MIGLKKYLENLDACSDSIEWAEKRKTSKAAWLACPRADWLLWLAPRIGIDKNLIILVACDCAASVLHLIPEGEERPRKAIETTRAFVAGKATEEEVRAAAADAVWDATDATNAARAAARAARYAADAYAAYAAYFAAKAAYAARAFAVIATSDFLAHATNAISYARAAYTVNNNNEKSKEIADIVRKNITWM